MNIVATGRSGVILREHTLLITPAVQAESIYIYADETRASRLRLDPEVLAREGLRSHAITLSAEEVTLAVRYAAELDDGEAQTLAIATSRGLPILSDDARALRYAQGLGTPTMTSLDLIRAWSTLVPPEDVRRALRWMQLRANYAIPRTHPLREWYAGHLDGDE